MSDLYESKPMMLSEAGYHCLQIVLRRRYVERRARAGDVNREFAERECAAYDWALQQLSKFGFAEDVAEAEGEAQRMGAKRW